MIANQARDGQGHIQALGGGKRELDVLETSHVAPLRQPRVRLVKCILRERMLIERGLIWQSRGTSPVHLLADHIDRRVLTRVSVRLMAAKNLLTVCGSSWLAAYQLMMKAK
jgi:hypothetical protein